MAPKTCDICGEPAGIMKMQYHDGVTCRKCFAKANSLVTRIYKSVSEVRLVLEQDFSTMNTEEKTAFHNQMNAANHEKRMEEIQQKIKENNTPIKHTDNTPRCPKCGSTSISADKKGFGVGKAVVGAAVAGPIGLVAGNVGAKKVNITCLNCGHHWIAGKN